MSSHFLTTLLSLLFLSSPYDHDHARKLPPLDRAAREFLYMHNEVRAEVDVPPMSWNTTLAKVANDLVTYHKVNNTDVRRSNNTKYTQNILYVIGGMVTTVDQWVEYNMSCAYKQMVWPKSLELGCSQAECNEANRSSLTVCFYSPMMPNSSCQTANNMYKAFVEQQ